MSTDEKRETEDDALRGYSVWLDREQWGHVIDGLIGERARVQQRKAANSESTSDLRSDDIGALILKLNAADPLADLPVPLGNPRSET